MRRGGADFTAYVDARWPGLVRSVTEHGLATPQARDVVTDALDRCRKEWHEAERYGDIDAVVDEALHRALARYAGPRDAQPEERFDPGPPPTGAELDQRAWQRRARTNSRAVLVVAPLVVVVAAATWWTTRADPTAEDHLTKLAVTRVENPSRSVWYAAGTLHLAHVTLRVPELTAATRIDDGVVYADTTGRVVSLAADGTRVLLGHQDPGRTLHASDESGWAAWVDPRRQETVVVDVLTGRTVATRAGDRSVIAVDGDTVYVRNAADRLRAWQPDSGTTATLEDQQLLDVLGRKKAVQVEPGHVEVVQSLFAVDFTFPGTGARLSGDGSYLATRGVYGQVQLFDTRSGRPVADGLGADVTVLAATGGDRGTTTYVVDTADGRRLLEDCVTRTKTCATATSLPRTGAVPLLAR